jgi:hypothetical protein
MRGRIFKVSILCRLIIALILALGLLPISQNTALALSVDDYFVITYTVEFNKDRIYRNEPFYATVTGQATCIKDLPLTISEAYMNGCFIAEHEESGAKVTLNSSYTVSISPFPTKKGETTQSSQIVPLSFPASSQPGRYNVIGELIEARVKAVLWFTVTAYLPQFESLGSVTYLIDSGQEDTADTTTPGITDISDNIDWRGVIDKTIIARSADDKCTVKLNEGTKAKDKDGYPLEKITIVELEDPPALPEDCIIVSLTYNISPSGAIFKPMTILSITYDKSKIPEGVSEEELVIATWDEAIGEWVELGDCVVNQLAQTITAPISHFSAFTVMAHTAPPTFTISELTITPSEVGAGGNITITIIVINTGDLLGSYELTLRINNEVEETREVTLKGRSSEEVVFTTIKHASGSYKVNINGLTSIFTVTDETAPSATNNPTISPKETVTDDCINSQTEPNNSGNTTDEQAETSETIILFEDSIETTTGIDQGIDTIPPTSQGLKETLKIGSDKLFESSNTAEIKSTTNWWPLGTLCAIDTALLIRVLQLVGRRRFLPLARKQKKKPVPNPQTTPSAKTFS